MSFDFSAQARSARDLIPVPAVPMDAIRGRSNAARKRGRLRALVACAAIFVVAVGAGAGVGAKIYDGVRVRLAGGSAQMRMHSALMLRQPTASELRGVVARATFPVVFPAGLPAGTRVDAVYATPDGRPRAIFIRYLNPAGDGGSFVLLDPDVVETDGAFLKASASLGDAYDWRVGGEIVLTGKNSISPDGVARVKAAMANVSPAQSLAATEAMLPTVTVLGDPVRLQIAERIRPQNGRSVLLSPNELRSISRLAKRRAPVLDSRTFHLTRIPYANGQIDYRKARGRRSTAIGVSASGVRAIDAVLRSAGGAKRCGCEILFNQPNGTTYWVWTISMSGPAVAKKYAVDARTLIAEPAPAGYSGDSLK